MENTFSKQKQPRRQESLALKAPLHEDVRMLGWLFPKKPNLSRGFKAQLGLWVALCDLTPTAARRLFCSEKEGSRGSQSILLQWLTRRKIKIASSPSFVYHTFASSFGPWLCLSLYNDNPLVAKAKKKGSGSSSEFVSTGAFVTLDSPRSLLEKAANC